MRFQIGLPRALLAILFLVLGSCLSAFAQVLEMPSNLLVQQVSVKPYTPWKAQAHGEIAMEGAQYLSTIPEKSQLDQSLLTQVRIRSDFERGPWTYSADFSAGRYVDWGVSHYSLKELYGEFQWNAGQSEVSVGRRLQFWSQADHVWNLGIWQPYSLIDSLRPEEQGLSGVFIRHQVGDLEFLGLGSPIFIPTMGPEIKEENGSLVSDSRWFRSPSPNFILFEQKRQVVYSLNLPNISKLVNKPGVGFRLSWGQGRESGAWASANFGYKPINTLILKYDQRLALSESGQDLGSAVLYPDAAYHNLSGGDLGYRFNRQSSVTLSYLEDRPVNELPQEPFIVQFANPVKIFSLHAETQWKPARRAPTLHLSTGYLRLQGGDYADFDYAGQKQGAVFAQRFNFSNAAFVQAQMTSSFFRRSLVSKIRYLRDFDQRGLMINASTEYLATPSLALTLGADVLGVDDSSADNKANGFLNEFRANDRYFAGISYVY